MRLRPGRPFRRPGPWRMGLPLFGPRSALAAALLPQLDEAHRLLAAGHPAEAAPIFAQLAQAAEAGGMPRRAAHLHLQAARCLGQIGSGPAALTHARAALSLFVSAGAAAKAAEILPRLVNAFRARGLNAEAAELRREAQAQLALTDSDFTAEPPPAAKPRGHLPAKCSHCGGPVRSDEVEWIDERSAECDYCGSVLYLEE